MVHSVFFYGIRKDPFNGLLVPLVQYLLLRRTEGILRQLLVVLPDVALYCFCAILGAGTQVPWGTACEDPRITSIFPVVLSVCGAIMQHLV